MRHQLFRSDECWNLRMELLTVALKNWQQHLEANGHLILNLHILKNMFFPPLPVLLLMGSPPQQKVPPVPLSQTKAAEAILDSSLPFTPAPPTQITYHTVGFFLLAGSISSQPGKQASHPADFSLWLFFFAHR